MTLDEDENWISTYEKQDLAYVENIKNIDELESVLQTLISLIENVLANKEK